MEISISFEGQSGLSWMSWKRWIAEIEQMGFAGLFRADHFNIDDPHSSELFELVVLLANLASLSQRVHFGSLVAPLSVRDPVMLARQAMALNDLSGGRMILGVGAGWNEEEHAMFGYSLGDKTTRMDRLEEGLEVITRLLRSSEPVSYEGRFFHLHEALLLPRPQHLTPVLVGGTGLKRMLPLVARYADIWNSIRETPDVFKEHSILLDDLLRKNGRQPGDVKRTLTTIVVCYRDPHELDSRMTHIRSGIPGLFAGKTNEENLELLRNPFLAITGSPEEVIKQLRSYAAAGVEELIIQWFTLEDYAGLNVFAEEVMPFVSV